MRERIAGRWQRGCGRQRRHRFQRRALCADVAGCAHRRIGTCHALGAARRLLAARRTAARGVLAPRHRGGHGDGCRRVGFGIGSGIGRRCRRRRRCGGLGGSDLGAIADRHVLRRLLAGHEQSNQRHRSRQSPPAPPGQQVARTRDRSRRCRLRCVRCGRVAGDRQRHALGESGRCRRLGAATQRVAAQLPALPAAGQVAVVL